MIDNLPEYVKLNNAYNPAHYPANKKISAEEWNALWLSVIYQGNHQEDVLASILNVTIPENIDNINNLINITSTHTSLLAGLRSDVDSNTSRIGFLESFTIDLEEAINNLDSITANHEGRINTLENTDINHNSRINTLEDVADDHEVRVDNLETDVNILKEDIPLKAYLSEVYRHYSLLSPLPSDIVYIREGRKTLYIEFSPEIHTIIKSDGQAESITGSIIALALLPHINSSYTIQREIFRCEYGDFVRHIVLNKTTWSVITVGEWQVLNSDWYNKLDLGLDIERARIDTIMQDYDTITSVNAKVNNVQTQVTSNRTDINNLLGDYVRKQDNTGVTYLTQSLLEVSDTGALIHLENLKQIGNGTASTSRQTTPIPVVDNKARLFLPQEISTLRNLESWKESLLGEALNYIVDFSDMPSTPTSEQLQTYLNNKWASIGGTTPILDQNTMVDPNIPLSYKWFVNSNAWVFFQGSIEGKATNNIYDEVTGELLTAGALGKVVGSNKHFYAMVETNGEIAINGLDALEEEVGNNSSDIAELQEDLSDQTTALSNHMSNISNPHSVAFSQLLNKPTTLAGYGITDAAAKLSIGQWQVPYRDIAGNGEPNSARFASMTSPLPQTILIRDAEGKATFVGGTSANQGIVKSQLDAVQGNVDTVQSNLNTHTENTDIHVTTADKNLWNNKVNKSEISSINNRLSNILYDSAGGLTLKSFTDSTGVEGKSTALYIGNYAGTTKWSGLYSSDSNYTGGLTEEIVLGNDQIYLAKNNNSVITSIFLGTGSYSDRIAMYAVGGAYLNDNPIATASQLATKAVQPYIQRSYSGGNGIRLIGTYNYSTSVGDTRPLFYMVGKQGHGNGTSYLWQGEYIFGVNTTGVVTAKAILKVSDGTFGKFYYRHDTENQILYLYIYTGQYSSAYFSDLIQINAGNYSSYFTLSPAGSVTTDTIVEGVNILYPASGGTIALTSQIPTNASFTLAGLGEKSYNSLNDRPALDFLPLAGGNLSGSLTGTNASFTTNDGAAQASVLKVIENVASSGTTWKGRIIVGVAGTGTANSGLTFLMGVYNGVAGLGAHYWSQFPNGAAWAPIWINPDGGEAVAIGKKTTGTGWANPATNSLLYVNNSTNIVTVNGSLTVNEINLTV